MSEKIATYMYCVGCGQVMKDYSNAVCPHCNRLGLEPVFIHVDRKPKENGCKHLWKLAAYYPDVENSPKDKGGIRHDYFCTKCGTTKVQWGVFYD